MKKTLLWGVTLLALFAASSAHAAIYIKFDGVDGESTARASSTVTTRATTSTQAATEVEAQASGGTEAGPALLEIQGVEGDTDEKKGGNVEFEWKVEEGESADEKGGTEDINIGVGELQEASMKGGVSVAAGDVDGLTDEEKQEFLAKVKAHAQLQSGQDLENFAKGILLKDENVAELSTDDEVIRVKYRTRGYLLWVLPLSFTEEASVDTDADDANRVKVKFPWYAALMATDVSKAELQAELEAEFGSGNEKWMKSTWGVAEVAEAFTTISIVFKTKHDTAKNSVGNVR